MEVIAEISHMLQALSRTNNEQIKKYLKTDDSIALYSGNSLLCKLTNNKIFLCGKDISEKLKPKKDRLETRLKEKSFENFIEEISDSLLRLNHIGINYWCSNIEDEINFYKELLKGTSIKLYEEKSDDPNMRWLFMGDITDWESPLFEIVINDRYTPENEWRPHFQIDIDTTLKQEKLEKMAKKYFDNDSIPWKLEIPNYGVVMEMLFLESIKGSKIYLGVGTDIRGTKYHREKGIVEIL